MALGRLARHKGFDLLLEAFRQVADKHPQWIVEIYGEGDQRQDLERLCAAWNLDRRILLPGWTRDPQAVLSRADLFVLPSRYEGFPNALLEAMACGLASVSFACSEGLSEIVRSEVDGLLVPAEDVAALAVALDRLMSDEGLRRRLGERARDVVQRFSSARFFRQWDAVGARAAERWTQEGGRLRWAVRRAETTDRRSPRDCRFSPQRVDERRHGGAAQHDQDPKQQERQDDRRQPPLLVVQQEVDEFGQQSGLLLLGLCGEFL